MQADCGCYSDEEGNWVLSEECQQRERDEWAQAMEGLPALLARFRDGTWRSRKRYPRFYTVDGKLRLVEDVYLPGDKDTRDVE